MCAPLCIVQVYYDKRPIKVFGMNCSSRCRLNTMRRDITQDQLKLDYQRYEAKLLQRWPETLIVHTYQDLPNGLPQPYTPIVGDTFPGVCIHVLGHPLSIAHTHAFSAKTLTTCDNPLYRAQSKNEKAKLNLHIGQSIHIPDQKTPHTDKNSFNQFDKWFKRIELRCTGRYEIIYRLLSSHHTVKFPDVAPLKISFFVKCTRVCLCDV